MNFNHYFDPVYIERIIPYQLEYNDLRFVSIDKHTDQNTNFQIANYDLALIGVPEDRNTENKGCDKAPDKVRNKLYQLYKPAKNIKIIDLGNLKRGKKTNDTYFAVRDIVSELIKNEVIPIIVGGGQDITYANYLAYEKLEKTINIASIDSHLDLGNASEKFNSNSFLSKIILHKSNYLFNFSNIGYQTYYVSPLELDLMQKLFFDVFRLGTARSNLHAIEPIVRDSDIISLDICAIKQSEAPAHLHPSPNGFMGDEICQIARYAGLSDKVSSIGIYETNPKYDINSQTSHLTAQIIWHFIEGFIQRCSDYPYGSIKQLVKHIVSLEKDQHDLTFYQSKKTDRWWLEVPFVQSEFNKKLIVACSYEDYQNACNQELPERWLKFYQKIN